MGVLKIESYTILNNDIFDDRCLNPYEKLILIYLIKYTNNGKAYPSLNTLSEKINISKPTLIKNIKNLEGKKYIAITKSKNKGDFDNNNYFVLKHLSSKRDLPPSKGDLPQVVKEDYHGVVKEVYSKNTNKKSTNKKGYLNFTDIEKVTITREQYEQLVCKYNKCFIDDLIFKLDNYIINGKGSRYKDHYKVLLTWARSDKNKFNKNLNVKNSNCEKINDEIFDY